MNQKVNMRARHKGILGCRRVVVDGVPIEAVANIVRSAPSAIRSQLDMDELHSAHMHDMNRNISKSDYALSQPHSTVHSHRLTSMSMCLILDARIAEARARDGDGGGVRCAEHRAGAMAARFSPGLRCRIIHSFWPSREMGDHDHTMER